jgi:hypothetical protein
MHSDDLSKFHVDLEGKGRKLARRAMDTSAAQLGRLCIVCHCAI